MSDRHPFHILLPQYAPALRRRALKLTGNPHRAEDLVQDTFLKAWANRASFRPGSQLRAWLFTILRNTFYSDQRKFRREVEDVDGALGMALSEAPRQEHALSLMEVISAIALLPDAQARALVLTGAYGYSQLEAADVCGCSVGTIKSRVSRSRAALIRMMAHDEVNPVVGISHDRSLSRRALRPCDLPEALSTTRAIRSAGTCKPGTRMTASASPLVSGDVHLHLATHEW